MFQEIANILEGDVDVEHLPVYVGFKPTCTVP